MDAFISFIGNHITGFFAPVGVYGALLLLHLILPARKVAGYVSDETTGKPLMYRLNGLLVMIVAIGAWAALGATDIVAYDWLYQHRWAGLAGACTFGLIASFAIVVKQPPVQKNPFADFFFGRLKNPQFFNGRVDAKMILYLVGATLLGLNILSAAAFHIQTFQPTFSQGIVLYTALFLWFLFDYMTFERVHLYTYDLFAERVGYKLTWGCLTFYPYFYAVGIFAVAHRPDPGISIGEMLIAGATFFLGWSFARGANMQKFYFKTQPHKKFLGIWTPRVLTDGKHALLCNGFWGLSRHINYLGEVLMATGLTLALGMPFVGWTWLYPLYYVLLLSTRERDDDKRCDAKYGNLWKQYCNEVPYRIIPRVY